MRSLEEHLSPHELASLPGSPEELHGGKDGLSDYRQIAQHLAQCEVCGGLARDYWSLARLDAASKVSVAMGPCFEESVWLEFAAGLLPEQAATLRAHAASCDRCAALLKDAMALMQPNQSEDLTEVIAGLASSTPEWQRRVGAQMASEVRSAAPIRIVARRRFSYRIALPIAAALLVAVVLGGAAVWRLVHPSEARLLALAYNKQRTLALRIPGADPVPMATFTRGADGSGSTDPTELIELKLRAQQHLDRRPNSAYWHQILGEIQLQEQDALGARRSFETAQTIDPALPNLKPDLAAAWFEVGEKLHNSEAYATAANLYLSELQAKGVGDRSSEAALLHYNLAQCWERQNQLELAVEELRQALRVEGSAAWRTAMEAEIARLSTHAATSGNDGFETALDDATSRLLAQWTDSSEARARIVQVAALGVRHHDLWLRDWIGSSHTPLNREADKHLGAAVAAGNAGQARVSLDEAEAAAALYRQGRNQPGLVRAELAKAYALQRLGRAHDCVAESADLEKNRAVSRYAWLDGQMLLEQGNCDWLLSNIDVAQRSLEQSSTLSVSSELPLLHLRALGFQASHLRFRGMNAAAWAIDTNTLELCDSVACPPIRRYQFLYDMVRGAEELGLHRVAAELMRTAESVAAASGDATIKVYALETLGLLSGRVGDYKTSSTAFEQATASLRSGKQSPNDALYLADWQTDRAEILVRQGLYAKALDLLGKSGATLLASDYSLGRIHYFSQLSAAERGAGHLNEALVAATQGVSEAERSLDKLHTAAERDQWARANQSVYEMQVQAQLARGQSAEALQAWERFRRAPYLQSGAVVEPVSGHSAVASDLRVLVLAKVQDRYVGWLVQPEPFKVIRMVVVGDQSQLQQAVVTFYRQCADRDSNVQDIQVVGAQLYRSMLQPFRSDLAGRKTVYVDLDSTLGLLPLSALTAPDGSWLGSSVQFKVLPPWWSGNPSIAFAETHVTSSMAALVVNGFGDAPTASRSEAPEVAHLFHEAVLMDDVPDDPKVLLDRMRDAEVFHFSGHATNDNGHRLIFTSKRGGPEHEFSPGSLGSVSLRRCKVAVLAACNTIAADPNQMERLPDVRNALLLAGANSVVASGWDVDDQSTHALMVNFYKGLMAGDEPVTALQAAEKDVRSRANWQHPFYWASFELFTN